MAYLTKQQVQQILSNAPANLDKTKIIQQLAQSNTLEGFNDQQQDGFLKSAIKDPINTLLVNPATRIGQAIVAPAGNELQQGNTAARETITSATTKLQDELRNTTDPARRAQLQKVIQDNNTVNNNFGSVAQRYQNSNAVVDNIQNIRSPFGNYSVQPQKGGTEGVKQITGQALKTASYLYAPGAASEVAAGARSIGRSALQAGIQGAKAGAIAGGTYNAGEALSQNQGIQDTITSGVTGALTGAAIGGFTAAALSGVSRLPEKVKASTIQKYDEIFSGTKSGKTLLDKSVAQGKNPSKFLVDNNFIVDIEKGKINSVPTIDKIKTQAQAYDNILDEILKTKDETLGTSQIHLDDIANQLKKKLATPQNEASGYMNTQLKAVDNLFNDLKSQFGDTVNLEQLNQIKQAQWAQSAVFDATRPNYQNDIHYNLGSVVKKAIEDHVSETDIRGLNNYIGDHYNAIKNLQKVDGKTIKGGRLGNYAARIVGSVAGATHGVVGSVAGAQIGDAVSTILQNNYLSNPIKKILLARIIETEGSNPQIIAEAQNALSKLQLDPLYKVSAGKVTNQVIQPKKLEYFKPNTKKPVKVNNYQSDFPKYIIPKK